VLFIAGLHVPDIPFVEVVGSAGIVDPEQYGPGVANEGVIFCVITIVREAVVAHRPGLGVKV